jgi:hypothetical protein
MSTSGRFVVCRERHLRFAFPAGAHFDLIAKQFESHLCGFQCLSNDDALSLNTATPYDPNSEALNRFDFDHSATPMWVFDIRTTHSLPSTIPQYVITATRERSFSR